MKLHDLQPAEGSNYKSKRVGRGHGSGKGKTAGRGMGGQKAREGRVGHRAFEGGQNEITRGLPFKRGVGFNNRYRIEYKVFNIGDLAGSNVDEITPELLVQARLTPTQALMAGTANSARVLGLIDDRGTIEAGKRADLVLVAGRPWAEISDVRKTVRVFIDGRPVHGPGVMLPKANSETAMPVARVKALVDDFERADGRTNLDTLRTDDMDGGIDRTVQVSQVIDRAGGGKALALAARMAVESDPQAAVILPLTRGSVQPADVSAFRGVRMELRGDGGPYKVMLNTLNGRWAAEVKAGPAWTTVEVPFSALTRMAGRGAGAGAWTGTDVVEVEVGGSREGGRRLWLELDNVSFY